MSATNTNGGGKRIGYVRVSSADQNDARQLDGVALDLTRFSRHISASSTKLLECQGPAGLYERSENGGL